MNSINPTNPIRIMDFRGCYKGGGGPDKTILNSAAKHDPAMVNVLVAYIRQPSDDEFQIADMAKSFGINYVDLVDRKMLDWSCIRHLKQVIQKEKITLLHTHDDKTMLYGFILKHLVPGLRIMYTCHSHSEYTKELFENSIDYLKFLLRKKILLWLMQRHTPPILTISENTRQRLIRGGLRPEHVAVLYNGIDINHWNRSQARPVLRKELDLADGDFLVGTVARIAYDKDFPTFYEVARRVKARMPNVKFVIVGDGYGDELEQAKKKVAARGLEHVVYFTGHRTDLMNIYVSFDLFLMTSLTEGLPNTVLEAMALEVPVVSTEVGGVPELIVSRENGLLCPIGDAEALADTVGTLLQQPQRRQEMAQKSRKRIEEKFNFSRRVCLLEDIYLYFLGKGIWPTL
ncbi:MAG: glycosyltransferase [Desulfobulbaceae bacterium C00003063]|nr:MAG: glycosyltransferase [Desulfobulbaceae bacterium C00003063]